MDDLELAKATAQAAAERTRKLFSPSGSDPVRLKGSAAHPVGAADLEAEAVAIEIIDRYRPGEPVIAEERGGEAAGRHWLVDALDGTINYLRGSERFCSAVALIEHGEPQISAVAHAPSEELYWAGVRDGAHSLSRGRLRTSGAERLSEAVLATYLQPERFRTAARMKHLERLVVRSLTIRAAGSGSLDLADVAAGRLDAWALPDVDDWDWYPGALLVREAGGAVRQAGAWRIAAATVDLADQILDAVSG